MTVPDHIVFNAEPLIAHADDEPGSNIVEEYPDAVAVEDVIGYANYVNLDEIRYIIAQKYDCVTADEYLDWLTDLGIEPVDVDVGWQLQSTSSSTTRRSVIRSRWRPLNMSKRHS
jgi:hypothetical protein